MLNFFKKFKKNSNLEKEEKQEKEEKRKNTKTSATGISIGDSIEISKADLKFKFEKPQEYSGNRDLFDSGVAKRNIKLDTFSNNETVVDPYTGAELELTKKAAKLKYGENWAKHSAEADHKVPLKNIHSDTKNNPWLTTDNVKDVANSDKNLEVVSRSYNNAKRDRSNEGLVTDDEYLKKTGLELSEEGKRKAIDSGKQAKKDINRELRKTAAKNIVTSAHNSGLHAAKNAGMMGITMSGIYNMTSVINGEKSATEAIKDVGADAGKAAVMGYVSGGGITVLSHSLSSSSSQFLQALGDSNVPAKVITTVALIGKTLRKYGDGEITTQECIIELGEKGLNFATTGYSMVVGQSLIPIPIVGAAVGALVGSTITSKYYNNIVNRLKMKELEHQERLYLIKEAELAAQESKRYREELENYLDTYFREYKNCFDEALSEIQMAFQSGDADSIISGANKITTKLGGRVHYNNVEEFKSFLSSDEIDVF